jgi:hypothetical protein
MRVARKSQTP